MSTTDTIQFQATPEFRKQLEAAAAAMNLSVSAYIMFLERCRQGRLDAKAQDALRLMLTQHDDSLRKLSE
ncbi:MAG: hypothetical protein R3B68_02675 [Phycisphaerales bacterium]